MSRAVPGPEDQHAQNRDAGGSATGCAEAAADPGRPAGRALAALAGLRAPVVWVLLAIAFFTAISGKPVDGVLVLIVAAGLAWDAGRRALRRPDAGSGAVYRPSRQPAGRRGDGLVQPVLLAGDGGHHRPGHRGGTDRLARPAPGPAGRRRPLAVGALLAGGAVYAGVMGSFSRYSWPATAGIIGLGTVVVLIGWHGPLRDRPDGGRLPVAGAHAWLAVLVAGCLWELGALLQQPSLTTDSYSHPTISTLTDPLLATAPGRSIVLFAWLALGWHLVER